MNPQKPHFLLFSQSVSDEDQSGRWHFVLEPLDGGQCIEASDSEPDYEGERLELLAVVRGLEALDQPSAVTLVTNSQQVTRGFRNGLAHWRANNWKWERFGRYVPVKNQDLWKRIDRALTYHHVECRTWRFDPPHLQKTTSVQCDERTTSEGNAASLPIAARLKSAVGSLKSWVMGEGELSNGWARTA
ncbi:MAG: hypothetical protein KDB27_29010 [Planctomycetales bacterium]|nr:hypothetical protein [Planctomycetales bacterium]